VTDLTHRQDQRGRHAPRDSREELAASLRRAFPLGESGSFVSLLQAIDERAA
jgi:hypothetical protein